MSEPRCLICDGKFLHQYLLVEGGAVHLPCHKDWLIQKYPVVCPKCNGTCQITLTFKTKEECCQGGRAMYGGHGGFAGCEWCPNIVKKQIPDKTEVCDLCDQIGRLKTAPTPITVTTVVGWKKE